MVSYFEKITEKHFSCENCYADNGLSIRSKQIMKQRFNNFDRVSVAKDRKIVSFSNVMSITLRVISFKLRSDMNARDVMTQRDCLNRFFLTAHGRSVY